MPQFQLCASLTSHVVGDSVEIIYRRRVARILTNDVSAKVQPHNRKVNYLGNFLPMHEILTGDVLEALQMQNQNICPGKMEITIKKFKEEEEEEVLKWFLGK